VTRRKPSLKSALADLLGRDDCFIAGTKIEECGKTFSIRPQAGEEVVGIRMDGCQLTAQSGPACDAAFFVHIKSQKRLVIVLVELKGGEIARAFEQLIAGRNLFATLVGCAATTEHGKPLIDALGSGAPIDHGAKLLGVVASKRGIPQPDRLKILAHRQGIKIVIKEKTTGISCSDLIKWQASKRG